MAFHLSDHYDGKRFFLKGHAAPKKFLSLLKWKWESQTQAWPRWVESPYLFKPTTVTQAHQARITFVNHATCLIECLGYNLLTDPVYAQRVSPFSWAGPKRVNIPGVRFEELPNIHGVLISHNHYDHLDISTVKKLWQEHRPQFFVPLGVASIIQKSIAIPSEYLIEMDWWEQRALNSDLNLHFLPAQHWSGRGLYDYNQSLWGSFVVESKAFKIYFAGDTGYGPHFNTIYERLGAMDFSLLPIGAYRPQWFMQPQHLNPPEAVQAHLDLHSRTSFGIHFGTFQLSDEGIDEPVRDLKEALNALPHSADFIAPQRGESRWIGKSHE